MARFSIDPDNSQVWIEGSSSVHPIRATATGLTGWFEAPVRGGRVRAEPEATGELTIEVDRLRSGNRLVDMETRRRIDARTHRTISGQITAATRIDPGRLHLEGTITFRGVEAPVAGEVEVTSDEGGLRLSGAQTFDVRTWGLEPPRVGLLRVHPEIVVRIDLLAVRP